MPPMDTRTIAFAVAAALLVGGRPHPAKAPPPTPLAAAHMAVSSPIHSRPAMMVSFAELQCLARNVYWEARGESAEGQLAVAWVTLNRVGSVGFPASICEVVYQGETDRGCQFGWTCDGRRHRPSDKPAWQAAEAVAVRALAGGTDPTNGALHFHREDVHPAWAGRRMGRIVIGNHVFFRAGRS